METDPYGLSQLLLLFAPPSWELLIGLLAIAMLLVCSALISGSEVAFFSLTHNDFEKLEEENSPSSQRIIALKDKPRRLLATILIGNNFVNIAIVLLSDFVLRRLLPPELVNSWAEQLINSGGWWSASSPAELAGGISFLITVVGVTFLLVLFGEAAPKVYANTHSVQLARQMSNPLLVLMRLFYWPSELLVNLTNVIEKRLKTKTPTSAFTRREDIDEAIALTVSTESDSEQDTDILKRILKFTDVSVRQIMRSRVDIVAVENSVPFSELLQVVRESGYSRIPVYQEDVDQVIGILYVKDLLGHLNQPADFAWQTLIRTNVLFVPEAKKINELLREFQKQHLHMAIVVDEYGGTSGLATLEDVLEEVIGDIQDEFDEDPEVLFEKLDDYNYIFDGKSMLNDVCRILGVDTDTFDEARGESDSLAGLVLEILGDLPEEGQQIRYQAYEFKVVAVTERRIERILITSPSVQE